MKPITIVFLIMSQNGISFFDAFEKSNVFGRLTLLESVEVKAPRNFIASATFTGSLMDCLNFLHYLGGVGVRGIVESAKDNATLVIVGQVDRDLITDKNT